MLNDDEASREALLLRQADLYFIHLSTVRMTPAAARSHKPDPAENLLEVIEAHPLSKH
jgi:hypothetical protein